MKVLAKFRVYSIEEVEQYSRTVGEEQKIQKRIKLTAVQNEIFGPYTPSGDISMLIVSPDAYEQFHVGKEYYVTFKEDTGDGAE